jgi:hypothetical protein
LVFVAGAFDAAPGWAAGWANGAVGYISEIARTTAAKKAMRFISRLLQ